MIQKLEADNEKLTFTRVDSDHINNLIKKDEETISNLSEEEKEKLKTELESVISYKKYSVQLEALDSHSAPFVITQPEFLRRIK